MPRKASPRTKGTVLTVPNDVTEEPSSHLIKAYEYVHIANKCSYVQKKMVNVLLANAYSNLLTKREHEIPISVLCEHIGLGSNNIPYVKELFRNLMDIKFEWNILDTSEENWTIVTAVSRATIRGNTLIYAYDDYLARQLYNPAIYAALDLQIQNRFTSTYAYTLYEQIARFLNQGLTATPKIPIKVFRKLMGVDDDKTSLQEFKIFNRAVLKPAMDEINRLSDLWVEVEFERESRRVAAVQFSFRKKHVSELQFQPDLPMGEATHEEDRVTRLAKLMMEINVSKKDAESAALLYDDQLIIDTVQYAKDQFEKGEIKKSIGAYFLATIKKQAVVGESTYEKELRAKKDIAKRQKEAQSAKAVAKEMEGNSAWKSAVSLFEQRLAQKSEVERQQLIAAFAESGLNGTIRAGLNKQGIERASVRAAFTGFAMPYLLTAEELEGAQTVLPSRGVAVAARHT